MTLDVLINVCFTCNDALDAEVAGAGGRSRGVSVLRNPGPAWKRTARFIAPVQLRQLCEIHHTNKLVVPAARLELVQVSCRCRAYGHTPTALVISRCFLSTVSLFASYYWTVHFVCQHQVIFVCELSMPDKDKRQQRERKKCVSECC